MADYILPAATGSDGDPLLSAGITGLALGPTAAGLRLFTSTGSQGGIAARLTTGSLATTDSLLFGAPGPRPASGHLEAIVLNGAPVLAAFGAGAGLRLFSQAAGGPLATQTQLGMGNETLLALAATALPGGQDAVFTSSLQSPGVTVWLRSSGLALTPVQTLVPGDGRTGMDILDLAVTSHAGSTYLLAVSARDDELSVYRIGSDGRAVLTDTLGPADGLGIDIPGSLATLSAHGHDFVLLGAAGSSTITVAEIGDTGRLTVHDEVGDDLSTRFQGVPALATATLSGRAFVLAAGADDGLTLMELLPDGRLIHRDTIADDGTLPLANPAGIALASASGGFDIFAASSSESGVVRLHADLGTLAPARQAGPGGATLTGDSRADLLLGGAGADTLSGGAGDDILVDGAGSDRMTGGAGADIFVFTADGSPDEVMDFQPGFDRLDLSALGRLYSLASLDLTPTADGIEIRFGTELIRLHSASGQTITTAALGGSDLFGLWHVPVLPPADAARVLSGTSLDDMLLGKEGNDILIGGDGADRLTGDAGADTLLGESTDPGFDTAAAAIYRLYEAAFGRAPAPAGHYGFTTQLLSGTSLSSLANGFLHSAEFQARYGPLTNAQFFVQLFENVLHRTPTAANTTAWATALNTGAITRAEALLRLSESAEHVGQTSAAALDLSRDGHQAQWTDEIYRLFCATLGREPAEAGLIVWTDALAHGRSLESVAAGLISSAEFQARYGNTTNSEFVVLLFQNVLHRMPAASGVTAWTTALNAGAQSRAQVVLGLANSAENQALTAPALTALMRSFGEDDRLEGGTGADTLFGGFGADTFVFTAADGTGADRVAGLEPWDRIELDGFGYGSGGEALGHFTQSGQDTLFQDAGVSVIFEDTRLSEIHPDMLLLG